MPLESRGDADARERGGRLLVMLTVVRAEQPGVLSAHEPHVLNLLREMYPRPTVADFLVGLCGDGLLRRYRDAPHTYEVTMTGLKWTLDTIPTIGQDQNWRKVLGYLSIDLEAIVRILVAAQRGVEEVARIAERLDSAGNEAARNNVDLFRYLEADGDGS